MRLIRGLSVLGLLGAAASVTRGRISLSDADVPMHLAINVAMQLRARARGTLLSCSESKLRTFFFGTRFARAESGG